MGPERVLAGTSPRLRGDKVLLDPRLRGDDKRGGNFYERTNTFSSAIVKTLASPIVIPAKAGIQSCLAVLISAETIMNMAKIYLWVKVRLKGGDLNGYARGVFGVIL